MNEYIEQKLVEYLIFRATLYPPAPNTYQTDEHFVIGWNLVDYDDLKCCDCIDLEAELIKELNLKVRSKPQEMDFTK